LGAAGAALGAAVTPEKEIHARRMLEHAEKVNAMNAIVKATPPASGSVLVRMANRYGVDPDKMMLTLKATAFKGDATNEQLMALAIVADQYGLNPWLKEIYAFPSRNGIVPVVGVDGWSRIINTNPDFNGMDFAEGPPNDRRIPEWIECRMHRKGREYPVCVKEYFEEVNRNTDPWKSHPRRMLRHKAMIQCARLAFGFVGIYDEDEGERIIEVEAKPSVGNPRGDLSGVDMALRDAHVAAIADILNEYGSDETIAAQKFAEYIEAEKLNQFQELWITIHDKLSADGIISKSTMKKYQKVGNQRPEGR
jgi:phage recombination protein Bet